MEWNGMEWNGMEWLEIRWFATGKSRHDDVPLLVASSVPSRLFPPRRRDAATPWDRILVAPRLAIRLGAARRARRSRGRRPHDRFFDRSIDRTRAIIEVTMARASSSSGLSRECHECHRVSLFGAVRAALLCSDGGISLSRVARGRTSQALRMTRMVACIITKDVVVLTPRARISAVLMCCARVALACGGVVGVSGRFWRARCSRARRARSSTRSCGGSQRRVVARQRDAAVRS